MAIQRNAIVAPFSVNSPLFDGGSEMVKVKGGTKSSDSTPPSKPIATTHQKWLQSVANGINLSVQLSDQVPASSTSTGQPGTLVPFAGGFYLCVGPGSWLKFLGAPF